MKRFRLPRLTFWSGLFYCILAVGLYSTVVRFFGGLGASTHLSDQFPWGLWIGFDVLCGVGLAAGGFIVAATVYLFNLQDYKPILRPAILTAFLGYILVIVGLMFDLGRPWNIWHPLIMWNPHSVMFEVGWCVMLYSTVLALEFSPIVFERLNLERPKKIIHSVTIPLVILGVILSSLHQSSLGSLFLIVPAKLYPLWYSPNLPYLFFVSALAVGPAMVMVESYFSSRAFHREIEIGILKNLGKVSAVALALLLVLKVEDILSMHLAPYVFTFNFEAVMYWVEIMFGIVVPMVLLFQSKIRASQQGLFVSSLFIVLGFILNRLNVSLTALEHYAPVRYFPSWMEISITLMIVAIGFVAFRLAVQYLPIFIVEEPEEAPKIPVPAAEPYDVVSFIEVPTAGQAGIH
ncbi:MAG: NrfD/PsrC family molybdoenzyme membrane anchor subunit [Bacteroidota bacterium]